MILELYDLRHQKSSITLAIPLYQQATSTEVRTWVSFPDLSQVFNRRLDQKRKASITISIIYMVPNNRIVCWSAVLCLGLLGSRMELNRGRTGAFRSGKRRTNRSEAPVPARFGDNRNRFMTNGSDSQEPAPVPCETGRKPGPRSVFPPLFRSGTLRFGPVSAPVWSQGAL